MNKEIAGWLMVAVLGNIVMGFGLAFLMMSFR